ncbi:MAG TPA: dTDP-4-dehydrorhamnose 3,5-epimerase [Gemmatimonadales bacterium]|nr:dTDP-4-dehydrorhamnose 3,5-epimerase [Gemmatimonadales bacterium]
MKVAETAVAGVLAIDPVAHEDARGFFLETWREERYRAIGVTLPFVQDNHSRSGRGVLRGMHYQLDAPQGKLVTVARGAVFDVAVDLRRSSPTFGGWAGVELTDANHRQLWIPPGCAHGFYVLSETADVIYKSTAAYLGSDQRAVRWDDPSVGIDWPLAGGARPQVSPRDAEAPYLSAAPTFP